jgi:hypothetical protein
MTLRTIPVIPRTKRPSVTGAPVWYAEALMARTQLDINITIPTGNSRKLILLWGSDGGEFPVAVTFDPAGEALEMRQVAAEVNDTLRIAAYYLDAPPPGLKVVRIATANPVWSVARLMVVQDARTGDPWGDTEATSGSDCSILIEPLDAFSETFDLILDDRHGPGELTAFDGQTPLDEALINASFLAAASSRTHAHNNQTSMAWYAGSDATTLLQVAVNALFSAGQIATSGPLSLWRLDEIAGTVFADTNGISNLGLSEGAVAPVADPLLADGGKALSVQNAGLRSSGHSEWQVPTWTFSIYCQPRSAPSSGSNRIVAARDANLPPGGWSIEQYNDGGTSRLRAYIRNSSGGAGSAIWIGSQTGQGILSLNVAHRIDLTFDGTTASLYLDRNKIASSSDVGLYGMQDNAQALDIAHRGGAGAHFDGILDHIELREGVLSAAEIAAAPAPTTITDPGAPSSITAIDDPRGIVAANSNIDVDVTANDTGIGAGNLNIDITQQPSAGVLTIVNDNTPNARVRISTIAAPAQTTQYSGRYHVSEAGGAFSNEATISWSVQAATGPGGYTPFPFITVSNPPVDHTGVASLPAFNAANPRSASFIDPMSGLEIFRVTGNNGTNVLINGTTNSGFTWTNAGPLPENNPKNQNVWNSDATLMFFPEWKNRGGNTGTARNVLFDVDASHGNSNPWTPLRVNMLQTDGISKVIWDIHNPLRMYAIQPDGLYEYWPIGGQAHSVGQKTKLLNWPTGFGEITEPRAVMQLSLDGRYHNIGARRNSDGMWGGFRIDVINELVASSFIDSAPTPPFPLPDPNNNNHRMGNTTPLGTYGTFGRNGDDTYFANMNTGGMDFFSQDVMGAKMMTHWDSALIDGQECAVGYGTYQNAPGSGDSGEGFWVWDLENRTGRRVTSSFNAGIQHTGSRSYLHLFETYGGTGSGSTTGQRYALHANTTPGSSAGIRAIRMGANDFNQVRYLCNHRSVWNQDNTAEVHPNASPNWEYMCFNSNWQLPGVKTSPDRHGYVCIIPDAFRSPNNDGS